MQIAADGVPVVIHDDTLRRTAGIDRSVLDSTGAELRTTCVGEAQRLGNAFPQVRIPTLDEAVALVKQSPQSVVFVEIKRASLRRFGREHVVPPILHAIETLDDRCVAISFDAEAMAMAKQAGFRTGWAFEEWNDASRNTALDLASEFLFCKIPLLPPAPTPLWDGPWTWVAYETGDPHQAVELAARGIAYVETDSIGEMLAHPEFRAAGHARA